MGSLHFLDLVIGLVFIYFLLSLICVSLQELKANYLKERSENLRKWVFDTFNGKDKNEGFGARLWNNIIIDGMTQADSSASYIPKEVFVSAVLDELYYGTDDSKDTILENPTKDPYDFNTLLEAIENPAVNIPKPLQRVIKQIHFESHQNLETFRMRLERWFEMAMDRNAGTFKKKANRFTFFASIGVTLFLNVDTIKLADYLYNNKTEAAYIANIAATTYTDIQQESKSNTENTKPKMDSENIKTYTNLINSLNLPIGWKDANWEVFKKKPIVVISSVITTTTGWIITIFAVSLGAPFWFDTLNKLVNLRSAGKIPNGATSPSLSDPNSKDTQSAVG